VFLQNVDNWLVSSVKFSINNFKCTCQVLQFMSFVLVVEATNYSVQ